MASVLVSRLLRVPPNSPAPLSHLWVTVSIGLHAPD